MFLTYWDLPPRPFRASVTRRSSPPSTHIAPFVHCSFESRLKAVLTWTRRKQRSPRVCALEINHIFYPRLARTLKALPFPNPRRVSSKVKANPLTVWRLSKSDIASAQLIDNCLVSSCNDLGLRPHLNKINFLRTIVLSSSFIQIWSHSHCDTGLNKLQIPSLRFLN